MNSNNLARILLNQQLNIPIKSKDDYVKNIKIGSVIAFKINDKIMSAKVIKTMNIVVNRINYIAESIDGKIFNIDKEEIIWVKTGKRWPRQIFEELYKNGGKQNA